MNVLPRLVTSAAFAMALGAGVSLLSGGEAQAALTIRHDCLGDTCVKTTCDDAGVCTRVTTYDQDQETISKGRVYQSGFRDAKPLRYACDVDGNSCHYTRSYYLDDDGNAVFDPGVYP